MRHRFGRALAAAGLALAAARGASAQQTPPASPPRPATPATPASPRAPISSLPDSVRARLASDSVQALTYETFYRQILAAHPVAIQAGLARQQAREELRIARGGFEPTLSATVDRKTFNGSLYYNYAEGELKIPTPFGSDIKFGYERAIGNFIAADRRTGAPLANPGIFKLGFSLPVGQNIITDARRNALAQARALQEVAEADRVGAVNKLLLTAAKDYADWYEAHRRRIIAREGVAQAEFRLNAVRARVESGEAAAIDTLEALLEVQRRTVTRYEAEQRYYAATLTAANYLWEDPRRPLDVAQGTVPTISGLEALPVDSTQLPRWLELAARQHPDLLKIAGRIDQAQAARTLALQQVLPFAELSLNSVANRTDPAALTSANRFDQSYVLGGTVRTPFLFLRERGRFNAASQRLEINELEQTRVQREVELEVRTAVNDLATIQGILLLQRQAVQQARALLLGEQRRFENGESQLLIVNLRERLVLDEELKLASLEAKYAGARAALAVSIGAPAILPDAR